MNGARASLISVAGVAVAAALAFTAPPPDAAAWRASIVAGPLTATVALDPFGVSLALRWTGLSRQAEAEESRDVA